MKRLRLLAGIVLLLAGMVGLVVSVLAVFGARQAATSLSAQSSELLGATADALQFLKRGTTKIHTLLSETQEHAQALDATLTGIAKKVKASPTGKTLLDALDQSIARQLERAQATVATLQATLEGFHATLVLFHSLPGASTTDAAKDDNAPDLPQTLLEASEILEQLAQFLNEVLTNREVTRTSLSRLMALVEQIQGRLFDAEGRIDEFQQRLSATAGRIAASRTTIPAWIDSGSLFATILLVCFAFTQIGLMLQACRLLRGPKA